jgi:hypothetical protein
LCALEDQEFKQGAVVVYGHTPLFVMIADHDVALCPRTPAVGHHACGLQWKPTGAFWIWHGTITRCGVERLSRSHRAGPRRPLARRPARP